MIPWAIVRICGALVVAARRRRFALLCLLVASVGIVKTIAAVVAGVSASADIAISIVETIVCAFTCARFLTGAFVIAELITRTRRLCIALRLRNHFTTKTIIAANLVPLAARFATWRTTESVYAYTVAETVRSIATTIYVFHAGTIFAVLIAVAVPRTSALTRTCTKTVIATYFAGIAARFTAWGIAKSINADAGAKTVRCRRAPIGIFYARSVFTILVSLAVRRC